ncbi:capsid maturation protease [Microbacterium phage SadLad]|nr:capsid maturation protease [Microbacterium phage SadLad]
MSDDTQTEHTGVGVFLIPAENDPIRAASSEKPAHMTTIWLGSMEDLDEETLNAIIDEVRAYSAELEGPVVVPTTERGPLGDEGADVQFLEKTESLVALRDGLLAASPTVARVMESVEQFPEWTPHVTLGYPETPAAGEYDGDAVTFDRVGLWIGPDQDEYPMGDPVSTVKASGGIIPGPARVMIGNPDGPPERVVPLSALEAIGITPERLESLRAAASAPVDEQIPPVEGEDDDEMPYDELEDGEEEILEIPVHGVATIEGRPTGDGRGFKLGALSIGAMPQPLGYEYVSGHGSDTSMVAIVGRIDEYWREEVDGVNELRWRGVIMPGKEYGARAIESIVDGSYTGLSVIVDAVTVDVEEEREAMRQRIRADMEAGGEVGAAVAPTQGMTDEEIEALVDTFVGDGKQPVTWFAEAQVRRFDMVPTGAFQEGYVALGHEFADELTDEQLTAAAAALEDCGCGTRLVASAGTAGQITEWSTVDVSGFTAEELAAFDLMDVDEQHAFAEGRGLIAAFAPGTKDGPGWITHPVPTARIRRYWVRGKGAAKIRWGVPGDFNRCRSQLAKYVQSPEWLAGLCANMHKEAIGVWPGQEGGGRGHSLAADGSAATPAPLVVMASATTVVEPNVFPASAFEAPNEGRAFAMRIDKAARTIKGYAASWNECHIGVSGVCTKAPYSATDYAYFRKGVVDTDQGEQRVALITYGIGHADPRLSAQRATAHYDQTDAVRCYINIGEDEFGIWYAGVFAPFVTEAQMDEMRAIGRVSGDWRSWSGIPGDLEMVGLVCVNTEGFQLAASAAIGIGSLPKEDETLAADVVVHENAVTAPASALAAEEAARIARAAAEHVLTLQREEAAMQERLATARATLQKIELAAARQALANTEV